MTGIEGDVKLPGVGDVPKKWMIGIGVPLVGYVAWRYYTASKDNAAAADPGTIDPGMQPTDILPIVPGAVSGVGLPTDTTSGGTNLIDTNAEWTQSVRDQLAGTYDDKAIVDAIGRFLAGKALTTADQVIIQAAIAVAGYPPVGTHPIKPGGDTPITVAPGHPKVTATTSDTATVNFDKVPGAGYYRVYRSGASTNVGSGDQPPITVSGLQPNTSYTFYVAADTTSGIPGPRSSGATGKTKGVSVGKVTGVHATSTAKTSANIAWTKTPNATYYRIYCNGVPHGAADAPHYTVDHLKPNTAYKITVAADTTTGAPGPGSNPITVRTKK